MLCIFAGIYKLISKMVPIIDFYNIDDVLYWFKYIFFSLFICVVTVVKTHLCSCFPHDGYDYYSNRRAHTITITIVYLI